MRLVACGRSRVGVHENDSNAADALGQQPLKCHSELVTIQPLPHVQPVEGKEGREEVGGGRGKGGRGGKEGGKNGEKGGK